MKNADPFYKSAKWKRLRNVILRRDGYMCQISKRYGKHVQADTVHHIFPREQYPEYKYAAWNLISLSAEAHNRMHDRVTNALTDEGMELLRRTAKRKGIDVPEQYVDMSNGEGETTMEPVEKILVCGYPGAGKTTWVREHLGNGIAYDLDAIAAAFRLREPHEEQHDQSRRMANDLLYGFLQSAGEYSDHLFIIRTAPRIEELQDISPTRVVVLLKRYVKRPTGHDTRERLQDVVQWCEDNCVPVQIFTE